MRYLILCSLMILIGAGCAPDARDASTAEAPEIPTETAPVAASKRVDFSGRGLTSFPKEVLEDTGVVDLDISDNALTGAMPAEIRFLKRLKSLNASGNRMTGVPAEIGQLADLENLNLSDNELTGLPHELANLGNLKILNLRGNDISETDLEIIRAGLPTAKIFVD